MVGPPRQLPGGVGGGFGRHAHVSTRCDGEKRAAGARSSCLPCMRRPDVAEEVAIVASAQRSLLLGVHRHRLRREDLEDCYSQACLELVAYARRGGAFADRRHLANAIQLRFLSRVRDRHRAINGRSSLLCALEQALPLGHTGDEELGFELTDERASVEAVVLARDELRALWRAAQRLTVDQRRVLASQLADETCERCCLRLGWTREKYRKVAQRARAHLRREIESRDARVPSTQARSERTAGPINGYLTRS
jgi:DNA-directed RNA polymerase specialized sigma24 family protein